MTKTLKYLLIVTMILTVAILAVACDLDFFNTDDDKQEADPGFKLELVDGPDKTYTFYVDEVDFSQIKIRQIGTKTGEVLTTFNASKDLVSDSDKIKITTPGTYIIGFTYSDVTVNARLEIIPKPVSNQYTIIYDAGDGYFSGTNQNTKSQLALVIDTIPIPVRTGYEFGGWYFNRSFTGDKLVAPYTLTGNTKVYAQWKDERQFTVIFRSDVSQEVIARYDDVEYGMQIIAPNAPEVVGYTFTGWRGDFSNIVSDTTVWAEYSRIRININYTSEAWSETYGTATRTKSVYYGETLNEPIDFPVRAGYTGQWVDENTGLAPVYTNLTRDINIIAKYNIITYSIKFYVPTNYLTNEGDTLTFERTVNYNSTILQIPNVPNQEGYSGAWKAYSSGRLVDVDLTQNITANLEVYARYSKRTYTVTFNYDGGAYQKSCAYGEIIDEYDTGLNPKYYTVEWYNAQTYAQDKKITFPYLVTSSINFYMKKTALPYKVDFCVPDKDTEGEDITNYLGDKVIRTVYVVPGGAVVSPTISLSKYDLIGWIDATTGNDANFEAITDFHEYNEDSTLDKAFYAKLKVKEFNVDFYNMVITSVGGIDTIGFELIASVGDEHYESQVKYDTIYDESRLPDNTQLVKPTYPVGEDKFEFVGWFTTSDFSSAKVDFAMGYKINDNVKFYAKWMDKNKGSEELKYQENGDGSYSVVGFDSSKLKNTTVAEVNIPRMYNNKAVTKIKETAFSECESVDIRVIEISNNIIEIEDNAFSSCKSLSGFKFIGGVTQFAIVDNVLYSSDMKVLYRFGNTTENTSFVVPKSVTKICGGAFAFSSLETLTFEADSELETIGNGAFRAMSKIKSIALPSSLKTIEVDAFRDSQYLKTVTIAENNNLTFVGANAFTDTYWWYNCKNADKIVKLGKVLILYCNYEATELDLTEYVSVADGALGGYADNYNHSSTFNLESIVVNSGSQLATIGEYAFSACSKLKNIYLRSNTSIEIAPNAFVGIAPNAKLYIVSSQYYSFIANNTQLVAYFGEDNCILL